MNSQFDTLEYAAKLEAAGVPPAQAAVHAQALGGVVAELAFAADLKTVDKNLRGEMAAMEKRLLERIETVRVELLGKLDVIRAAFSAEIAAARSDLGERITKVESDIKVMRIVLNTVLALNIGILVKLLLM